MKGLGVGHSVTIHTYIVWANMICNSRHNKIQKCGFHCKKILKLIFFQNFVYEFKIWLRDSDILACGVDEVSNIW
jgi:hypothetical protein